MRKAEEAQTESIKALQQAQKEREKAEKAASRAEAECRSAREEAVKRIEAEKMARSAKRAADSASVTYKSLYVGNVIFTAALAIFMLYDRRIVLKECLQWFIARGDNIKGIALWVKTCYIGAVFRMGASWGLPSVWGYLIATVAFLIIAAVLLALLGWIFIKICEIISSIRAECADGIFKGVISADIALVLFFVCLWFYDPIKSALHLNIFSIWLIFSIIGCMIWNAKEIINGVKSEFN